MKIKVLHIITGLGAGGAERVLLDLIRHSDKERFEHELVSLSGEKDLLPQFERLGIPLLIGELSKDPVQFLNFTFRLNRHLRNQNIRLLHLHMFHPLLAAFFLKVLNPSTKIVFTAHSIEVGSKLREFTAFLSKPFRNVDIVFSSDMNRWFSKKPLKVIYNGVAIPANVRKKEVQENFVFLAIGGLRPVKNHLFLLDCAGQLLQSGARNFKIQIAGKGAMEEKLKTQIRKRELSEFVELLGFQTDIQGLCSEAHAFVMPSHYEGLPLAMLEAGANALPVIVTPVGAIPNVIDEKNGYLKEPSDFAQAMVECMANYDEALQKGLRLRELVKKEYSLEAMVRKHEELYLELNGLL